MDHTRGHIAWHDLTVPHADKVADFYHRVVGWKIRPVSMGEYQDFEMLAPAGNSVAGVCFPRGVNANIPPQWILYVTVPDVPDVVASATRHGGKVVYGPQPMGGGTIAIIQDPAGAYLGLYHSGKIANA